MYPCPVDCLAVTPPCASYSCVPMPPTITGHDLVSIGMPPGPDFARALDYARSELLSGAPWEAVSSRVLAKFAPGRKLTLGPGLRVAVAASPSGPEEMANMELALARMEELTRSPVVRKAALMPDACPSGSEWGSAPVGGVVVASNAVIPAAHSADINCGMSATFFESSHDAGSLMRSLRSCTVFGPFPAQRGREYRSPVLLEPVWSNQFLRGLEEDALRYLGTQGDGNHFAYLGRMKVSHGMVKKLGTIGHDALASSLLPYSGRELWALVTHHGSRNFGAKVYRRGLDAAVRQTGRVAKGIPRTAAWLDLDSPEGRDYWAALEYVSRWTAENHSVIHAKFMGAVGAVPVANVSNHHNAVWRRDDGVYHGKGATPAWRVGGVPQLGIIPLNMGREILLVEGLDNVDFLSFAPHGAGRNRSRKATKEPFVDLASGQLDMVRVVDSIREQVGDLELVWASGKPDISESPLGYKSASKAKEEIERHGLARIVSEIRPKGCMMAGDFGVEWRKRRREKDVHVGMTRGESLPRPECRAVTQRQSPIERSAWVGG